MNVAEPRFGGMNSSRWKGAWEGEPAKGSLTKISKALPLFAILITVSACSGKTVIFETVNPECYAPTRPELTALDEREHIGSKENVKALILNIGDLAAYSELLEATLRCYSNNPKEAEPKTGAE